MFDVHILYTIYNIYRTMHFTAPTKSICFQYAAMAFYDVCPAGTNYQNLIPLKTLRWYETKKINLACTQQFFYIYLYHKLIQLEERGRCGENDKDEKQEGLREGKEMRGRRAKGKVVKVVEAVSLRILQVACCGGSY